MWTLPKGMMESEGPACIINSEHYVAEKTSVLHWGNIYKVKTAVWSSEKKAKHRLNISLFMWLADQYVTNTKLIK